MEKSTLKRFFQDFDTLCDEVNYHLKHEDELNEREIFEDLFDKMNECLDLLKIIGKRYGIDSYYR